MLLPYTAGQPDQREKPRSSCTCTLNVHFLRRPISAPVTLLAVFASQRRGLTWTSG